MSHKLNWTAKVCSYSFHKRGDRDQAKRSAWPRINVRSRVALVSKKISGLHFSRDSTGSRWTVLGGLWSEPSGCWRSSVSEWKKKFYPVFTRITEETPTFKKKKRSLGLYFGVKMHLPRCCQSNGNEFDVPG